ncbi:flagellar hook-length control protein FliK [Pararhodobacter aggregans]|nr:flagellar hook-length control protein FliK [Pararhodobacter aggregans]
MPLPDGAPVPLAPPPGTAVPIEQAADLVPRLDAPQRVEVMADPRPGATPPLDTPHRIAQQIAARLETGGPGRFDLALKPEELGHVRLKLVSHETGSLLIVHAERPETLDLMRRHIGALEQDLRALGHDQLSLRFSGGNAGGAGQQATPHAPPSQSASQGAPPADPRPQTQPAPAPTLRARDHLDLRL